MNEEEFESVLQEILENWAESLTKDEMVEILGARITKIRDTKHRFPSTNDRGVVIALDNGDEFELKIVQIEGGDAEDDEE